MNEPESSPKRYGVTIKARYASTHIVTAENPERAYEIALAAAPYEDTSDLVNVETVSRMEFIDYEPVDDYDIELLPDEESLEL
jgi:hypothetical protein